MDWLLEQQGKIEENLAAKHLAEGTLILYDVTSTYFEGETCPLAQYGYSRDKKKGKLQIIFGLLCNASGCPIAVEVFSSKETVRAYKSLSQVEQAFRCYKTIDLKVRPIYHRLASRVRAHVFLCLLAYYVEWHMRQRLAPLLFDWEELSVVGKEDSVVVPVERQAARQRKAQRKRTLDDFPVHSFRTLLTDESDDCQKPSPTEITGCFPQF